MPPLMLVRSPDIDTRPEVEVTPEEKMKILRGEVYSGLEDRLEELRNEASDLALEMNELVSKIDCFGFKAMAHPVRIESLNRLISEVKALQEVAKSLDSLQGV